MSDDTRNVNKTIADWIGDIVALESHVEEAMDHQLELESSNSALKQTIKTFHDTIRDSKQRAVAYQEQYGSEPGNPVIKRGAELLGKAAGLIDQMRKDTIAKALRDDYTTYNHVAIAYTMLHTTAMALGDTATQSFAEQGLRTYAGLVQEINNVMPQAVVEDLKDNGDVPSIDASIVEQCRQTIDSIWKTTA